MAAIRWPRLGARRVLSTLLVLLLVQMMILPSALAQSADTTPPTFVAGESSSDGNTVILTFNEDVDGSLATPNTFEVFDDRYVYHQIPSSFTVLGATVTLKMPVRIPEGATLLVAYDDSFGPLQDSAGNQIAGYFEEPITNKTDATAPTLQSATANGDTAVFTFSEALQNTNVPLTAFYIDGDMGSFNPTSVTIAGDTVTLKMPKAAQPGQNVSYSYTDPGDGTALMDGAGNHVANFSGFASNVTPDTPPVLSTATIDSTTLILTYDQDLNTSSVPATTDFTVMVAGKAATVSNVGVAGAAVTLTLAAPANSGETVTLSYTVGTSPIQDVTFNNAAPLTNEAVTNNTLDVTAPTLSAAAIDGATLTLTYSEDLDSGSVPAQTDFTVNVAGSAVTINSVGLAGAAVTLTLAASVNPGDSVGLSYTASAAPIQDAAGNPAADLTGQTVTNKTGDTTPPTLSSAVTDGPAVTLTYSESLDTNSVPAAGDFAVTVAGNPVTVSSVSVAGTTVKLTLATEANAGDAVTVDYTVGTKPIQDVAGNAAAALSGETVINNAVAPLTVESSSVSGTNVTLNWSENLALPLPEPGDFTVTANGTVIAVTSVSVPDSFNPDFLKVTLQTPVKARQTVTISYTRGTNPLKGTATGAVARDFTGLSLPNYTPDREPPQVQSLKVNGAKLTVCFDEYVTYTWNATSIFTVKHGGSATPIAVNRINGASCTGGMELDLASAVSYGETVTLSYTDPGDSKGLRDTAGNRVVSFTDVAVTNLTPPSLTGATVDGVTLTLTFDANLNPDSVPVGNDFYVSVGGTRVRATSVTVSGKTVNLTLGARTVAGEPVTMNYTVGTTPLQDESGTNLSAFSGRAVTNNTAAGSDTTAPTLQSAEVNRDKLVLTFSEPVQAGGKWTNAAIHVYNSGIAVHGYYSDAVFSGSQVTVTLDKAINEGKPAYVFYSPLNTDGYPLEDAAGNDVARIDYFQATNNTDFTPPAFQSATVNRSTLTLTYTEDLDPASRPAATDFTVMEDGTQLNVSTVSLANKTVTLTLASSATDNSAVTVSYTAGTSPLQDSSANIVAGLTDQAATNNTDTIAPALTGALVNGSTILLTYDGAPVTNSVPVAGDYTVTADGSPVAVNSVALSGAYVKVTLAAPVTQGTAVLLDYTPGGKPLKDAAGNLSAALSDRVVTNVTPADGVLRVGPSRSFTTIESAVLVAEAGNIIEVDDGTYTVSQTLNLNQENLTLRSVNGPEFTTIAVAKSTGIQVNAPNVTISGLRLVPADGVGVSSMILIANTGAGARVQSNVIDGAGSTGYGLSVQSGFTGALTISDNAISASSYGIIVGNLNDATVSITNNQVIDSSSTGIYLAGIGDSGQPNTNEVQITGNTVGDPTFTNPSWADGILVEYVEWDAHVVIANNTLPGNGNGISIGQIGYVSQDNYGQPDFAGPVLEVQDNTINHNGTGIYQSDSWYQGSQVTISGNKVLDSEYDAFYTDYGGAGGAQIVGNEFSGSGGSGLNFDGAWFDPTAAWTIQQNTITNNAGSGINLDIDSDAAVSVHVLGNTISGNGTAGLSIGAYAKPGQIAYNAFLGGGVGITSTSTTTIDATLNWWGAATGPADGQATGDVTTSPWISGMTWTPSSISLRPGQTQSVKAALATLTTDSTAGTVPLDFGLWAPISNNPAVATVTTAGIVTAMANGTATIRTGLSFDPGLVVTVTKPASGGGGGGGGGSITPPPAAYVTITAPVTETREATIRVSGTANPGADVSVGDTTATASAAGTWSAIVALAEGANTITASNGSVSKSITITRDSTPPVITLTASETETFADSVTLSATTEPDATLTIAGKAVGSGSGSRTVTLVIGSNTFTATAKDKLGNEGSATITVIRKEQSPANSVEGEVNPAESSAVEGLNWAVSLPAGSAAESFKLTISAPADSAIADQLGNTAIVAGVAEIKGQGTSTNGALHTFQKRLKVTFHYDPAQVPDPSRLAIHWYDPVTKAWVSIGGVVDPVSRTITAEVDHFTLFAALATNEVAPAIDPLPATTDVQTINVTGKADAGSTVILVLNGQVAATGAADNTGAFHLTATLQEGRNLLYVKGSGILASSEAVVTFAPATAPAKTLLTDVAGHWAERSIVRLVDQGIITGFEDRTYRPELTITRAEFTTLIARALHLEASSDLSRFTDEAAIPSWARSSVAAAAAVGIVRGRADGSFDPDAKITRAEAAVMIASALRYKGITDTGETLAVSDFAAIPEWAKASVQATVHSGVITGYEDGTFRYGNLTTRAEVAVMLARLLDVLSAKP